MLYDSDDRPYVQHVLETSDEAFEIELGKALRSLTSDGYDICEVQTGMTCLDHGFKVYYSATIFARSPEWLR